MIVALLLVAAVVVALWLVFRDTAEEREVRGLLSQRHVAVSTVGQYWISTVDLCATMPDGRRYETMVFGNSWSDERYRARYFTRDEALAGHEKIVEEITAIERALGGTT